MNFKKFFPLVCLILLSSTQAYSQTTTTYAGGTTNTNTNNNVQSGTVTNNNNNTNNNVQSGTVTNNNNNVNTNNNIQSGTVTNNNNNVNTSTSNNNSTNLNTSNSNSNNNNVSTSTNSNTNTSSSNNVNNNNDVSTSTSTNNNTNKTDSNINQSTSSKIESPPPSAIAPTIVNNSPDLCTTGISSAVQTQIFGFSGGATIRDENCEKLKLSKTMYDMGMKVAAVGILCQDSRVFSAMETAGTPCPAYGKIGKEATEYWEENKDLRPDFKEYTKKQKIIDSRNKNKKNKNKR